MQTEDVIKNLLSIADSYPEQISEEGIEDISPSILRKLYETMLKIRRFEEVVAELLFKGEIRCPTHLYIGEEAIAAGVCTNLEKEDYIFSNHRSHGHYIAKTGDIKLLMAELYGKRTGCSEGRGGSMHLVAPDYGFMGSSAIVGGNLPLAVGTALASKISNNTKVTAVFFGDGATDEGVFHEALNFASLYKLPVLFVCENNFFSTHLPLQLRQPSINLYKRAEEYGIWSKRLFGNDVIGIYKTSSYLVKKMRSGGGPAFIECVTFRWRAHVGPWEDIDLGFRKKELVEKWKRRCPLKIFEEFLVIKGFLSESERENLYKKTDEEIEKALLFAKESPYPEDCEFQRNVFC